MHSNTDIERVSSIFFNLMNLPRLSQTKTMFLAPIGLFELYQNPEMATHRTYDPNIKMGKFEGVVGGKNDVMREIMKWRMPAWDSAGSFIETGGKTRAWSGEDALALSDWPRRFAIAELDWVKSNIRLNSALRNYTVK